jgi:hypothetical protein
MKIIAFNDTQIYLFVMTLLRCCGFSIAVKRLGVFHKLFHSHLNRKVLRLKVVSS